MLNVVNTGAILQYAPGFKNQSPDLGDILMI